MSASIGDGIAVCGIAFAIAAVKMLDLYLAYRVTCRQLELGIIVAPEDK